MQDTSRYAVGLDVGTSKVRVVVGHFDEQTGVPTIVGVASEPNTGMRKGTVVNLVNTAQSVDKALEAAERMSGHQITSATVSVNGSHVVGIASRGVIAVGSSGHEINSDDIARVEEAATVVQLPANREIVEVTPRSYQLDGQDNIKDPLGMTGVRLEVDAYVITALAPHIKNLEKACEMTETAISNIMLSGLGAARAVLSDQQMENGVLLVDMGSSTTNLVVFDEGDLIHVAVLPVGGNNITNDLAIGLKVDLDVAERVKVEHAVAHSDFRRGKEEKVSVTVDGQKHEFETADIDMIVDARLEEIFEQITAELKKVGRVAKLPGGVVLVGGGAELKGVADYAKQALSLSARVGRATGLGGVGEEVSNPSYATAVGLMLSDLMSTTGENQIGDSKKNSKSGSFLQSLSGKITGIFSKSRS
jgi:cell division protein FtsA